MEAWALAEAGSGYCWNFNVYTSKDGTTKDDALGTLVVLDLVKKTSWKMALCVLLTSIIQAQPFAIKVDSAVVVHCDWTGKEFHPCSGLQC